MTFRFCVRAHQLCSKLIPDSNCLPLQAHQEQARLVLRMDNVFDFCSSCYAIDLGRRFASRVERFLYKDVILDLP